MKPKRSIRSKERGSITECAMVVLPAFTFVATFVIAAVGLTSMVAAHKEVIATNLASIANYNSQIALYNYLPTSTPRIAGMIGWQNLFIGHSTPSAQADAISTAQSLYGFDPSDFEQISFLDFVAGAHRRRSVGLTSTAENGTLQVGATFATPGPTSPVQQFYGIRSQVFCPELFGGLFWGGFTVHASVARGFL